MYRPYGFNNINATKYAPDIKSLVMNQFLGVDFTRGEFITDKRRSPDSKNVIWGTNPYLFDTRFGKKRINSTAIYDGEGVSRDKAICNGIHILEPDDDVIVHFGTKLYYIFNADLKNGVTEENMHLIEGITLSNSKTKSFMNGGKLYIIGADNYLVAYKYDQTIGTTTTTLITAEEVYFNGTTPYDISVKTHIPTTVISRLPSGGGESYEDVNMLTPWRKNEFRSTYHNKEITDSFAGDGTTVLFTLTNASYLTYDDIKVVVDGNVLKETTDYSIDRVSGKVTFETAPSSPSIGVTNNIIITYYTNEESDRIANPEFYYEKVYILDSNPIDNIAPVVKKKVNGEWSIVASQYYDVDYANGKITFHNNSIPIPEVEGVDNVQVTFSVSIGEKIQWQASGKSEGGTVYKIGTNYPLTSDPITLKYSTIGGGEVTLTEGNGITVNRITKEVTTYNTISAGTDLIINYKYQKNDNEDKIKKCNTFGIFGGSNDTRIFLTGNDSYPNVDWHSGLLDPTYFPDTGYTKIGNDNTKIMGYIKQYDTQMIIKESNQQDGSAYLRTFTLDSDGKPKFPVEQGSVGTGAINRDTFAYLGSSPLFLSTDGVIRVSGSNVDNQRLMLNVSEKVNSKLTRERNLKNAVGIEFKDQYFIFIGGHCYVCDTRMRYTDQNNVTEYEWMFWDNIDCQSAAKTNDYLLFGYNGILYRLQTNDDSNPFIEEDENGNKSDIEAYWTTPKLYFDGITVKKMLRDVYLMFGEKESIRLKITAIFDNEKEVDLGRIKRQRSFNFASINFGDFSFESKITTTAAKIRVMLENFDNVVFKFSSYSEESNGQVIPTNSSIGIDLFQVTYNFKNR